MSEKAILVGLIFYSVCAGWGIMHGIIYTKEFIKTNKNTCFIAAFLEFSVSILSILFFIVKCMEGLL